MQWYFSQVSVTFHWTIKGIYQYILGSYISVIFQLQLRVF